LPLSCIKLPGKGLGAIYSIGKSLCGALDRFSEGLANAFRLAGFVAVVGLAAAQSALAADMPAKGPVYKAPAAATTPWTAPLADIAFKPTVQTVTSQLIFKFN
jgi:hypothetical protein